MLLHPILCSKRSRTPLSLSSYGEPAASTLPRVAAGSREPWKCCSRFSVARLSKARSISKLELLDTRTVIPYFILCLLPRHRILSNVSRLEWRRAPARMGSVVRKLSLPWLLLSRNMKRLTPSPTRDHFLRPVPTPADARGLTPISTGGVQCRMSSAWLRTRWRSTRPASRQFVRCMQLELPLASNPRLKETPNTKRRSASTTGGPGKTQHGLGAGASCQERARSCVRGEGWP